MGLKGMELIYVATVNIALKRDGWCPVVNKVMNVGVPYRAGNFLSRCITTGLSRLCSMELAI